MEHQEDNKPSKGDKPSNDDKPLIDNRPPVDTLLSALEIAAQNSIRHFSFKPKVVDIHNRVSTIDDDYVPTMRIEELKKIRENSKKMRKLSKSQKSRKDSKSQEEDSEDPENTSDSASSSELSNCRDINPKGPEKYKRRNASIPISMSLLKNHKDDTLDDMVMAKLLSILRERLQCVSQPPSHEFSSFGLYIGDVINNIGDPIKRKNLLKSLLKVVHDEI